MKNYIFRIYYSIYVFFFIIGNVLGRPFVRLVQYVVYAILLCISPIKKIAVKNQGATKQIRDDIGKNSNGILFDMYNGIVIDSARKAFDVLLLVAIFNIIILFVVIFDIPFLYKGFGVLYSVVCCYLFFVVLEYTYPPLKDFYGYVKYFKSFSKQEAVVAYKWHLFSFLTISAVLFACYYEINLLVKMVNNDMSSYEALRYVINKYF